MLVPDDLELLRSAAGELLVQEAAGFVTAIDPTVTESLRLEGMAREVVSRVQRMRKEAGFAVSDRIRLSVGGASEVTAAVSAHRDWIAGEVLATELLVGPDTLQDYTVSQVVDLDGIEATIALTTTE
jgi:isoleucyl-tRNA synthetase